MLLIRTISKWVPRKWKTLALGVDTIKSPVPIFRSIHENITGHDEDIDDHSHLDWAPTDFGNKAQMFSTFYHILLLSLLRT